MKNVRCVGQCSYMERCSICQKLLSQVNGREALELSFHVTVFFKTLLLTSYDTSHNKTSFPDSRIGIMFLQSISFWSKKYLVKHYQTTLQSYQFAKRMVTLKLVVVVGSYHLLTELLKIVCIPNTLNRHLLIKTICVITL